MRRQLQATSFSNCCHKTLKISQDYFKFQEWIGESQFEKPIVLLPGLQGQIHKDNDNDKNPATLAPQFVTISPTLTFSRPTGLTSDSVSDFSVSFPWLRTYRLMDCQQLCSVWKSCFYLQIKMIEWSCFSALFARIYWSIYKTNSACSEICYGW